MPETNFREVWRRWVQAEIASEAAQRDFLGSFSENLVHFVEESLNNAEERSAAFRITRNLPIAERQRLFTQLLRLACESSYVPTIIQAREIILTLPRPFVVGKYELAVQTWVSSGDEWTCRRVLELAALLEKDLTLRLAAQVRRRAEGDIRKAAQDFLENPSAR
jgi:hypothetical protein